MIEPKIRVWFLASAKWAPKGRLIAYENADTRPESGTKVVATEDVLPLLEKSLGHLQSYGSGKGIGTEGIATMRELQAAIEEMKK